MYRPSFFLRMLAHASETIDHKIGWDRLPATVGLLALIGIRVRLREQNLVDGYPDGAAPTVDHPPGADFTVREVDGSYNDPKAPAMGMAGTRFGRNVPELHGAAETGSRLMDPNPRVVSDRLLLRREFKPATTLNILAAAWLQFQTRDWFAHRTDPERSLEVPRPEGDDWPEETLRIPGTEPDPDAGAHGAVHRFINTETHWWDASQLYGSTAEFQAAVRTGQGGRVRIGADGLIDVDPALLGSSGGADGWWLGLELMHTAFMREHNAIARRLHAAYPGWSDDRLFHKARLINAALLAKIHTVEWTPAILGHPTLHIGMRANWWGIAGERVHRLIGRKGSGDFLFGIPGSATDHHGAPYSITEDFVSVYRMHPLIPDDYALRAARSGAVHEEVEFSALHGLASRDVLDRIGVVDSLFSLGTAHPGAVTLRNSPRFMHRMARTDGIFIDVTAADLLRSRERGVPRYNQFRRLLHMTPLTGFEQFGVDDETREELRAVYGNDLEKVDLMTGLFGERLPAGFGFSDTAFRIFILMASRRLKSDRFFTVDFTPEVYTPEGMAWIDDNTMISVLLRHYPQLRPALRGATNGFAPWPGAVAGAGA